MIEVADGLTLPDDAASQVFAFLGRRGSGKTYACGRMVEQLHDAGAQIVVLDPVGVWYGLRLAADGVSPGIPIPVFGGQHGDIPLEATAGKVVAELVASKGLSVVLDVSEFTGADQRRFVAAFASELLHAKKRHKSALMVVWEEAQEFAPQMARGDVASMLGAVEKLVKLGRNFGVGTTLVTQRPQAVNKDVLNQAECLFAFQMTGPQERKAIDGWVQEKGADRSVIGELPGLPVGTALVWSPQWLQTFGRFKVLPKRTFDASATPGAATVKAAALGEIDLGEVQAAMKATIEKVKADDPRELRRKVQALEAELRGLSQATTQAQEVRVERVEVPVLPDAQVERLSELVDALSGVGMRLIDTAGELKAAIHQARPQSVETTPIKSAPVRQTSPVPEVPKPAYKASGQVAATDVRLSKAERSILIVLAQYPAGRTKNQVAVLTGYAVNGGGFNNAVSSLSTKGLLLRSANGLQATDAGFDALGNDWEPLPTGPALLAYWYGQLSKAERLCLEALASVWPRTLTKQEVAERAGYEANGGGFNNALSRLRTLELIEGRGEIKASDAFFEGRTMSEPRRLEPAPAGGGAREN